MVTSAADLGDLQTKPNNAYLPLHDIPFRKCQTKDIAMVTSAADLGDHQTKPFKSKDINTSSFRPNWQFDLSKIFLENI